MRVSAIIPAYNEERTVGQVVSVVKQVAEIKEVIVVDDGSIDATGEAAKLAGARVLTLPCNLGKGGALAAGLETSKGEALLFLDADLIGLQPFHIHGLLQPVLAGKADMTVGIFSGGRPLTDLAQVLAPFLSGQRAIRRGVMDGVDFRTAGFGAEVALSLHVAGNGFRVEEVNLEGLSHLVKEKKRGVIRGVGSRVRMYWEIARWVSLNKWERLR